MKARFLLSIAILFFAAQLYAQKGVVNNGAKIIVTNGGIISVTGGADGKYTNKSGGSTHGRIDLDGKIKLEGDWTNSATADSVFINVDTDGEVVFKGTATQAIAGNTTSFEKMTVNNANGVSLSNNTMINGTLSFTNGRLVLGANDLTLGTASAIGGTPSSSKMIVADGTGKVKKMLSTTGSFTFPVGEVTGTTEYSPITLDFTSGTFGSSAYATVNLTDAKHASNTSTTNYLTRYWKTSQNNISSFSCNVSAKYTDADIAGTEASIYGGLWNTPNWMIMNTATTATNLITGTVTQLNDITGGEYAMLAVSIEIADDGAISESAENDEIITVTLTNDDFVGVLNPANWSVTNLPIGVTMGIITRTSNKTATIALVGNRTKDYDANISNVTVTIDNQELVLTSSGTVSINSGVILIATNDSESITMTDDGNIAEASESGEVITVTAVGGTFATVLTPANWTLTNLPASVTKGTVTRIDNTTVEIALSGNRTTDYDANITNLNVTITNAEMDDHTGANLATNSGVTFVATDETVSIAITDDGLISETSENGELITVTLSEDQFVGILVPANWTVSNLPSGVTRGTITRTGATTATIALSGNRIVDFDSDITNISVQIAGAELTQHTGSPVSASSGVTITANNDAETISIADDGSISESAENGEIVTVTLSGGTFASSLTPANWTVSNLPVGVTKGTITRTSATTATIALTGNRTTDYDTDITNLAVTAADAEVDEYSGVSLSDTTGVTFLANNDAETISMSDDGLISEGSEDAEIITVTLSGGTFVSSLNTANWTLTNLPTGVSKGALTRTSATTATIALSGNATADYDVDITNLTLDIISTEIDDMSSGALNVATGVTFIAFDESLVITLADDGAINEGSEGGEILTVGIQNKTFTAALTPSNWTVTNLPAGITKGTITRINDTTATIALVGNRTVDYDANITNSTVQIAVGEIIAYSSVATIATGAVLIANNDPESIALSDDGTINEASENGEIITVDLSGGTFAASITPGNWTISNLPQGITVGSFNRISSTQVTLNLVGNRTIDYDADITDLTVAIAAAEIFDHNGADITANSGVTFLANNDVESIAIADDGLISEASENGEIVTVTLTGGTFVDPLTPGSWTLTNLPTGVSQGTLTRNSDTEAEIALVGNRTTDYDVNITNLTVTIDETEVDDHSGTALTVNSGVTFVATDEAVTSSMSDNGINESLENGKVITVTITEDQFVGVLTPANWTLSNLPVGVTMGTLIRTGATTATITLSGNRTTDYDSDITNFNVSIAGAELTQHTGSPLSVSSGVTFSALDDAESIDMSDDGSIIEATENGEIISVTLTGGTFASSLNSTNWTLSNLPVGVSLGSVIRTDNTHAQITLSGNRTVDYDADITTLDLSITSDEIDDHTGASLGINSGVTFSAVDEGVSISISDDGGIAEASEDGEIITVTLIEDKFTAILNTANWAVSNLPTGVTMGTITRTGNTSATITLSGNRTVDYDQDILSVSVDIDGAELTQHTASPVSASSGVILTALDDVESITMTFDGTIYEGAENAELLTIDLTGGTFADPLTPANWTLSNLPSGVALGALSRMSSVQATIELSGNRTTDYDVNITNLTLDITDSEIDDHSGADISTNTGIIFTAVDEPVTISITDDGLIAEAAENGEIITVSLTEDQFVPSLSPVNWILTNLPAGVTKGIITRLDNVTATIVLNGTRTKDYDTDITNLIVAMDGAELIQHTGITASDSSGVTFTANNDAESISMANDGLITENQENGEVITVTLSGGTYVNPLQPVNWLISNLPQGVSVGTINRINSTVANIVLNGNRTVDYDVDITNCSVTVSALEIDDHSGADLLIVSGVTFTAVDEPATIVLADDGSIIEANEDGEIITISLLEDQFAASLTPGNWNFVNLPVGVTSGTITKVDSVTATVVLVGNRTVDYDANITDMTVEISGAELTQHTISPVSDSLGVVFTATNDTEAITIADDGNITEGAEDSELIFVTLTGGTFVDAVNSSNWSLTNLPDGVTKGAVTRINSTTATIALVGNTIEDYDVTITNLTLSIAADEIDDHLGADISVGSGVVFTAIDEAVVVSMFDDGLISESFENGEVITVTIVQDEFVPLLSNGNWVLTNLPAGVAIDSVSRIDSVTAEIVLIGNRTVDFDTDLLNVTLAISGSELVQHNLSAVYDSSGVTITALNDPENISLSDDGNISESAENGEVITVLLSGGTFENPINELNWSVLNLPDGVVKGIVTRVDDTTATIELIGNRIRDYDADILDLTVTITDAEVNDHSGSDLSIGTGVTFIALDDPEVLSIGDDGLITEGAEDSEVITITLSGGTFADTLNIANWIISNQPTGVTMTGLTKTSPTSAQFTLTGNTSMDYDISITDFTVTVGYLELDDMGAGNIFADSGVVFNAIDESLVIALSDDGTINESFEDGEVISVAISDMTYHDPLTTLNWTVTNLPAGVTMASVTRVNDTIAEIQLAGNRVKDYDVNITNTTVQIGAGEIDGYALLAFKNTGVVFIADDDPESIVITDDGQIFEELENGELINVALLGGTFAVVLNPDNWSLQNLPVGIAKGAVNRINDTLVTVQLTGYRLVDFDTDILNIGVTITSNEVDDHTGASLTVDSGVVIIAVDEAVFIEVADDGMITEKAENGEVILVTIYEDVFAPSLSIGNWTATNMPEGVTLGSVSRISDATAELTLSGNRTRDYDSDILDFTLVIAGMELVQHTSATPTANTGVVFTAVDDPELINIADDGLITEAAENGEKIFVTLDGGTFVDPLMPSNWSLTNLPTGVTIGSITLTSDTTAFVTLSGNSTVDYDINITNVSLEIASDDIDDMTFGSVTANSGVTLTAIDENFVIAMADDLSGIQESTEDMEEISVTINGFVFHDPIAPSSWSISNLPVGVTVGSVTRIGDTLVTIQLSGNRIVDYDADITNLTTSIGIGEIDGYPSVVVVNSGVVFTANDDAELLTISDDGSINEGQENAEIISVTLSGGTFAPVLNPVNWSLINIPAGVTIGSVARTSDSSATITLSGNRTVDYDLDIINATLSVSALDIDDHSGVAISVSAGIVFIAVDELLSITDTGMTEANLNGFMLTLSMTGETFTDSILDIGNFILNNAPAGTSILSVTWVDANTAIIVLVYDGTDMSIDVTDFSITILGGELDGVGSVTSNDMFIDADPLGVSIEPTQLYFNIYSYENDIYISLTEGNPDDLSGSVSIFDLVGKEIAVKGLKKSSVNVLSIDAAPGYYLVKVNNGDVVYTGKILLGVK